MVSESPEAQLATFIAKYSPEMAQTAYDALARLRARLPNAWQLVYDNYNALVIGFGPSERPSEAVFSLVLFPRYASLCFLQGAKQSLSDPARLLRGDGTTVRSIRLENGAETLDSPAVQDLMAQSLEQAAVPLTPDVQGRLVIRSISAKQRPRLPSPR
jgi:hypothetical protein